MVPISIEHGRRRWDGHAVGRGDAGAIRRAGYVATWLGIVLAAVLTLAVILSRFGIAELFLGERTDATAALSATLLLVDRPSLIADAIQTVAAGALRGIERHAVCPLAVRDPQLLADRLRQRVVAEGFQTSWGAVGIWIGLSIRVLHASWCCASAPSQARSRSDEGPRDYRQPSMPTPELLLTSRIRRCLLRRWRRRACSTLAAPARS